MGMNETQLAYWEKMRQRGRKRFIWIYGVLGWGLCTGFLWGLIMSWLKGMHQLPIFMTLGLIGFPIGGYFFGAAMWKFFETMYERVKSESEHA